MCKAHPQPLPKGKPHPRPLPQGRGDREGKGALKAFFDLLIQKGTSLVQPMKRPEGPTSYQPRATPWELWAFVGVITL